MLQCVQDSCTHQTFSCLLLIQALLRTKKFRGNVLSLHPSHHAEKHKTSVLREYPAPIRYRHKYLLYFLGNVHIHFLRFFNRRNYSTEPAYRTQANIQIECLTQSNVQRTNASAYRCSKRALIPIKYSRKASIVTSGNHSPVCSKAFPPASTSFHSMERFPLISQFYQLRLLIC